jgi:hypothetical protein
VGFEPQHGEHDAEFEGDGKQLGCGHEWLLGGQSGQEAEEQPGLNRLD